MPVLPYLLPVLCLTLVSHQLKSQESGWAFEKAPPESGFRQDDYWVWCGSMIKSGGEYHLFASRWKKTGPFSEGYRNGSEIVRATSESPSGPFVFREVVIGERDSSYWDSNMAHNPTIHRIGDLYVLFYIGSDFTTTLPGSRNLLRRVGYATSSSAEGPWKRADNPVINSESNNPALLADGERILLVYRDEALRVYMAEADDFRGPYRIVNSNLWPDGRIEDFYLYKSEGIYHMICEDNTGSISGKTRWGVHLFSENGLSGWKKHNPLIAYDHEIELSNGNTISCIRRERPQLLIEDGKITYLITSVYDGTSSWSMPVKLTRKIKTEEPKR